MEETQADAYWAYTAKEKHRLMASLAKWGQMCMSPNLQPLPMPPHAAHVAQTLRDGPMH